MENKTTIFVKGIENACRIMAEMPSGCPVNSPESSLVQDLWKSVDKFADKLRRMLPEYHVPETASKFARAISWPDIEQAYRLPDGRLLFLSCEFTEAEILTENEFLHWLAIRCIDLYRSDADYRSQIRRFFMAH